VRFLANENFPRAAVLAPRALGHEVDWIREDAPGSSDEAVLLRARRHGQVLLTFDKDFGELAHRAELPKSCGIVLFRIPLRPAALVGARISQIVISREDWTGHFSVVEPGRIRMRPLT
jgi:hypothetical protein